jgi:hypothetical protein
MKKCFKCLADKDFSEFYRHSKMSDGYLNKCKSCTKKDVHSHRENNLEKIQEYDRRRGLSEKHRESVRKYSQTERGRILSFEAKKRWSDENKKKRKAHQAVQTAVRNGSLVRQPCERCGTPESEAHHEDYDKVLDVMWLCPEHHAELHRTKREEERKEAA